MRLEELTLERLVPLVRCFQNLSELGSAVEGVQKGVCGDIGIAEKAGVDATLQHPESGNLISQNRVGLRNLIRSFGITDASFSDLVFYPAQDFQSVRVPMRDRFTESLSDLRVQRRFDFVGAIEISGGLFQVLLVVLSESAIEQKKGRIIHVGQAAKKPVILTKIEIGIQNGTVCSDQRIKLEGTLALR